MKYVLVLLLFYSFCFSNTNRITTADGITCESSSESPYAIESYVESSKNDTNGEYLDDYENIDNDVSTFGVRFIYKFGEQKALNCNRLYNLELREKEAKVKELEAKIKALESTKNINWKSIDEK